MSCGNCNLKHINIVVVTFDDLYQRNYKELRNLFIIIENIIFNNTHNVY